MGNPKHIGRVGALVVALGVASTSAMATAEHSGRRCLRWGGDRRSFLGRFDVDTQQILRLGSNDGVNGHDPRMKKEPAAGRWSKASRSCASVVGYRAAYLRPTSNGTSCCGAGKTAAPYLCDVPRCRKSLARIWCGTCARRPSARTRGRAGAQAAGLYGNWQKRLLPFYAEVFPESARTGTMTSGAGGPAFSYRCREPVSQHTEPVAERYRGRC
jgi:hypothetical protein